MLDFQVNAEKPGKSWEPTPKKPLKAVIIVAIVLASIISVYGFRTILDIPLGLIAHHRLFELYGRKTTVLTLHSYYTTSCGYYAEHRDGPYLRYLLTDDGPWAEGTSPPWSTSSPRTRRWLNEHWTSCYHGLSKGSAGSFFDPLPLWFINRFAS